MQEDGGSERGHARADGGGAPQEDRGGGGAEGGATKGEGADQPEALPRTPPLLFSSQPKYLYRRCTKISVRQRRQAVMDRDAPLQLGRKAYKHAVLDFHLQLNNLVVDEPHLCVCV